MSKSTDTTGDCFQQAGIVPPFQFISLDASMPDNIRRPMDDLDGDQQSLTDYFDFMESLQEDNHECKKCIVRLCDENPGNENPVSCRRIENSDICKQIYKRISE